MADKVKESWETDSQYFIWQESQIFSNCFLFFFFCFFFCFSYYIFPFWIFSKLNVKSVGKTHQKWFPCTKHPNEDGMHVAFLGTHQPSLVQWKICHATPQEGKVTPRTGNGSPKPKNTPVSAHCLFYRILALGRGSLAHFTTKSVLNEKWKRTKRGKEEKKERHLSSLFSAS